MRLAFRVRSGPTAVALGPEIRESARGRRRRKLAVGRGEALFLWPPHQDLTLAKHSDLKNAEMEAKAHELWSESQRKQAKRHRVERLRMPCPVCESAGY